MDGREGVTGCTGRCRAWYHANTTISQHQQSLDEKMDQHLYPNFEVSALAPATAYLEELKKDFVAASISFSDTYTVKSARRRAIRSDNVCTLAFICLALETLCIIMLAGPLLTLNSRFEDWNTKRSYKFLSWLLDVESRGA